MDIEEIKRQGMIAGLAECIKTKINMIRNDMWEISKSQFINVESSLCQIEKEIADIRQLLAALQDLDPTQK